MVFVYADLSLRVTICMLSVTPPMWVLVVSTHMRHIPIMADVRDRDGSGGAATAAQGDVGWLGVVSELTHEGIQGGLTGALHVCRCTEQAGHASSMGANYIKFAIIQFYAEKRYPGNAIGYAITHSCALLITETTPYRDRM